MFVPFCLGLLSGIVLASLAHLFWRSRAIRLQEGENEWEFDVDMHRQVWHLDYKFREELPIVLADCHRKVLFRGKFYRVESFWGDGTIKLRSII